MRTKVLNRETHEINWDKKQWLISESGKVVFTNGKHLPSTFEGTSFPDYYDEGHFARN